jgi:hypothetical protein
MFSTEEVFDDVYYSQSNSRNSEDRPQLFLEEKKIEKIEMRAGRRNRKLQNRIENSFRICRQKFAIDHSSGNAAQLNSVSFRNNVFDEGCSSEGRPTDKFAGNPPFADTS